MADDPWAKFNPQKPDDWSKFNPESAPSEPSSDEPGTARTIAGGALQGAVFDPVEGIGQLIEHATGHNVPIPQAVRDWFDDYQKKYTSTPAGQGGRIAGAIGSAFIPAAAAVKGLGWVGKAAGPLTRTSTTIPQSLMRGFGAGGLAGLVEPVEEGQDYTKRKLEQVMSGATGGALVGPLGPPAAAAGTAYAASELVHRLGWPGALALFAGLGTSLSSLAHHHGLGQAGMKARNIAKSITDTPAGQYAAGRAAAGYAPDIYEDATQ